MVDNSGYFLRTVSHWPKLLVDFLGWAIPNVFLALLPVAALYFFFWIAGKHVESKWALANSVLLFYCVGLLGMTIYTLLAKDDLLLKHKRLLIFVIGLVGIVYFVTGTLYVWGLLVQHDTGITIRPLWDRQLGVEIATVLLVIPFAYFTTEGA